MILFVLTVQLIALVAHRKSKRTVTPLNTAKNMIAEEDEVDFDTCCGREAIQFVIPRKKYMVNTVIHALLSGPVCGMAFLYLLPSTINTLYTDSLAAKILLYVFGWMAVSVAQYSLTVAPPPETFVFRTSDRHEITPLSRPFYILLLTSVDLLSR